VRIFLTLVLIFFIGLLLKQFPRGLFTPATPMPKLTDNPQDKQSALFYRAIIYKRKSQLLPREIVFLFL
jgi:hypothetical protein